MIRKWAISILLCLVPVESIFLIWYLLTRRSGVSTIDLTMIGLAVFISILALVFLYSFQKNHSIFKTVVTFLEIEKNYLLALIAVCVILVECVQNLLFISSNIKPPHYSGYLELLISLMPLFGYGFLISVQFVILLFILPISEIPVSRLIRSIKPSWMLGFGILSLVFILFGVSKYGFVPYTNRRLIYLKHGHLEPTPSSLIAEQVLVLLVSLIAIYLLIHYLGRIVKFIKTPINRDWLIAVGLWLLAFLVWIRIPIQNSYFTGLSGSPNFTIYPISDAFYFDSEALRLFIRGEFTDRTTHVFYSFMLALLHRFNGPDFLDIINIQIGLLSLIPLLLYKMVSKVHTRFSGVLVALLYILRERNGLLLPGVLSGTVVNQLMTEPFALLGVIAFLYLIILWVQEEDEKTWIPLLAGSIIGVFLLVRAELLAILLSVCAVSLIYLWRNKKKWLRGMIQIWIIVGIVIVPWMSRNYLRNGVFSLDKGGFVKKRVGEYFESLKFIASEEDLDEPVVETEIIDPELLAYIPQLKNVPDHFINSAWQTLLYLPSSHQPLFTFSSLIPSANKNDEIQGGFFSAEYNERYVRSLPYYWFSWDGKIPPRSYLSMAALLVIVSLGGWSLWENRSSALLVLPSALISHILVWSLAGYSGGRFLKPSDWVTLVFYGIGLAEVTFFFARRLTASKKGHPFHFIYRSSENSSGSNQMSKWIVLVASGFFVFLGLAPVISEAIFPDRSIEFSAEELLGRISSLDQQDSSSLIKCYQKEIEGSSSSIISGKALYPRYFDREETLEDDRQRSVPDSDRRRLDFYLIGERDIWVSLPLIVSRVPFPHFSDVIVEGRVVRDTDQDWEKRFRPYFLANTVYVLDQSGMIIKISPAGPGCGE